MTVANVLPQNDHLSCRLSGKAVVFTDDVLAHLSVYRQVVPGGQRKRAGSCLQRFRVVPKFLKEPAVPDIAIVGPDSGFIRIGRRNDANSNSSSNWDGAMWGLAQPSGAHAPTIQPGHCQLPGSVSQFPTWLSQFRNGHCRNTQFAERALCRSA